MEHIFFSKEINYTVAGLEPLDLWSESPTRLLNHCASKGRTTTTKKHFSLDCERTWYGRYCIHCLFYEPKFNKPIRAHAFL